MNYLYQTVTEAIAQLKIIAKYADLPVPFICTGYVSNSGSVIGREKECREIEKWCSGNSKLLFVTGIMQKFVLCIIWFGHGITLCVSRR